MRCSPPHSYREVGRQSIVPCKAWDSGTNFSSDLPVQTTRVRDMICGLQMYVPIAIRVDTRLKTLFQIRWNLPTHQSIYQSIQAFIQEVDGALSCLALGLPSRRLCSELCSNEFSRQDDSSSATKKKIELRTWKFKSGTSTRDP